MIRILLAACLAFVPVRARADDAAPPLPPPPIDLPAEIQAEQKSVQAWGRANPDCVEWSDACVACTKQGCSTPGIACTPKETTCRRK